MRILAHRGRWKRPEEKNTMESLTGAFAHGFGIETDIRDYEGRLVISHNVADKDAPLAEDLFQAYREAGGAVTLALNVKADGIQPLLEPLLEKYGIREYFLFDMSVPELIVNEARGLRYYTRHSDVEESCVMYDRASGVWMDSFYDENWLRTDLIAAHLRAEKEVCIVSPELHGKAYQETWKMLKESGLTGTDALLLCTDCPDEAREYFYGKD